MDYLQQAFSVRFEYRIFFTENLFNKDNSVFSDFLREQKSELVKKLLFIADEKVVKYHDRLQEDINDYFSGNPFVSLIPELLIVPGGEQVKNSEESLHRIISAVDRYGIDRHSYLAAIGGGAVLDLAGYAAAIAHRGIRHIRIPTTVLSQNDSGVGVKNGINYFKKKNFLGTFVPPVAVFNDFNFLKTLTDADWRAGLSEAVKVALIRNGNFYNWLRANASPLASRETTTTKYLIKKCAELHTEHISGGDPFEMGSSRPLDFGHWSAHKTEQLSDFKIRHGEAVAMGIALDSAYSFFSGRLKESEAADIIGLLKALGFAVTHPLMEINDDSSPVLKGLEEFREHLGGKLTIMLLKTIGRGEEVHELDIALLKRSSEWLKALA